MGNITKLIPLVSSISSHGPKVKPIKNAPKYQQGHHHHHHRNDTTPASSGTANGSNIENAVPASKDPSTATKEGNLVDSTAENAALILAQDDTSADGHGSQGQKKNRNKRGGRGKNHGGGGGAIPDTGVNGGVMIPLGEANI